MLTRNFAIHEHLYEISHDCDNVVRVGSDLSKFAIISERAMTPAERRYVADIIAYYWKSTVYGKSHLTPVKACDSVLFYEARSDDGSPDVFFSSFSTPEYAKTRFNLFAHTLNDMMKEGSPLRHDMTRAIYPLVDVPHLSIHVDNVAVDNMGENSQDAVLYKNLADLTADDLLELSAYSERVRVNNEKIRTRLRKG